MIGLCLFFKAISNIQMKKIVIITGPTASGKTKVSIDYAKKHNGEIINADSQQIYSEIPILSAQPSIEEQDGIVHHMFGYKSLSDDYNVGIWLRDLEKYIAQIEQRGKLPVIVGGSVMYISSLLDGISDIPDINQDIELEVDNIIKEYGAPYLYKILYEIDPEYAAKITENDKQRISRAYSVYKSSGKPLSYFHKLPKISILDGYEIEKIIVMKDRAEIYDNINKRFIHDFHNGALKEVHDIIANCYEELEFKEKKAHGLKEIRGYIEGIISKDDAISKSQQIIRNYAKRQITWIKNKFKFN